MDKAEAPGGLVENEALLQNADELQEELLILQQEVDLVEVEHLGVEDVLGAHEVQDVLLGAVAEHVHEGLHFCDVFAF